MIKIAIDGPSGSGKSTLAKRLAADLNFLYLDTGAMYRTVGLFAKRRGIDPHDEPTLSAALSALEMDIVWRDGTQHMLLDGEDVSAAIRTPEMSLYASAVSALPKIRAFLLEKQRNFSLTHNVILDGRDIGTVVLPDADVKLFMVADDAIRAERRCAELREKGMDVTPEKVLEDMRARDKADSTRETAPLTAADDAILFDNSALDIEGTVEKAKEIIYGKLPCLDK